MFGSWINAILQLSIRRMSRWTQRKDASVLTNQEIKWAALLVVVVSFARAQLRKRWPDQVRRWEHPVDLLILVTVIFLMMAALTNLGREPGSPMPAGPTRIASVTLTDISLEHQV